MPVPATPPTVLLAHPCQLRRHLLPPTPPRHPEDSRPALSTHPTGAHTLGPGPSTHLVQQNVSCILPHRHRGAQARGGGLKLLQWSDAGGMRVR